MASILLPAESVRLPAGIVKIATVPLHAVKLSDNVTEHGIGVFVHIKKTGIVYFTMDVESARTLASEISKLLERTA